MYSDELELQKQMADMAMGMFNIDSFIFVILFNVLIN